MRTTTRTPRPRIVVGIVIVAAGLAGCGGGGRSTTADTTTADLIDTDVAVTTAAPTSESTTTPPAPSVDPTTAPAPAGADPATPVASSGDQAADDDASDDALPLAGAAGFRGVSLVEQLTVLDAPDGTEVATLPATTPFGTPTVVRVLDRTPGWVHVLVPIRPNDLSGWVREADVQLEPVEAEIHVDLASRTLRLTENGETTGEWPVAIGRSDRPTPTGSFFITDKLATGDAGSVWGAHAFGVSAFSDVLTDFIGGNGQVGIHGTNDPGSIGNDVSSGCIRLPNEVIDDLITRLPLGTPVHIV